MSSVANLIVDEISQEPAEPFTALRRLILEKKNLSKQEYSELVRLLESQPEAVLSTANLTKKETEIIQSAVIKAKIADASGLVVHLCRQSDSKNTPVFILALLRKRSRLDSASSDALRAYIHSVLLGREAFLCHFRLLHIVSKNYPRLLTAEMVKYCEGSAHPICKQIAAKHSPGML